MRKLLCVVLLIAGCESPQPMRLGLFAPQADMQRPSQLTIASWNVRGYPEKRIADTQWMHRQIACWCPDVLCVQEIGNADKVETFTLNDTRLKWAAFTDTRARMDNAIFAAGARGVRDLPDPEGFQHPAQAAFITQGGFDATVITVHLTWTDVARREQEMGLLRGVAEKAERLDPDVVIVGDFNLREREIVLLANRVGMILMVPTGQDGVGTTHANNRYDHFLVSPDLADEEALGCRIQTFCGEDATVAKRVSDHLPIVAWFRTDARFRDRDSGGVESSND